jgi:hypothetical protein
MLCRYCGSSRIREKKIEFRNINVITMKIKSSEFVTELECGDCGWIGSHDLPLAAEAF